jgi:Tfp pilus assembly protein PilF
VQKRNEKDPEKQRQMSLEAIQYYNKVLIYITTIRYVYNYEYILLYKDYGNARISYDNALRLSPRKKEVYNNIGVMFFNTAPQQLNNQLQRQYYDSAKVYFSKAVEIDSNYADAIGNLAVSYQYQGKNEEAIRFYEKALSIEINPNTVKNYSKLLNFLMKYDSTRKYIYEEKLNRINNIKQKFNLPI